MTQEQQELRRINWTEAFGFPHIFKSFKMAIYYHQIALALAAVVLVFCLGSVMDWVWTWGGQYAMPNEIAGYANSPKWDFRVQRDQWEDSRLGDAARLVAGAEQQKYSLSDYSRALGGDALQTAFADAVNKANESITFTSRSDADIRKGNDYADLLDEAEELFEDELDRIEKLLDKAEDNAEKAIAAIDNEDTRDKAEEKLAEDLDLSRRQITKMKVGFYQKVRSIRGETLFASLLSYEQACIGNALTAVRYGNFLGGMNEYRTQMERRRIPPAAVAGANNAGMGGAPVPLNERPGFVYWVLMGLQGVCWLVSEHWVYAVIFLLLGLGVMALFGGACHRMAALHFAREEKISAFQALRFAAGKFLSFYTAPLIPLAVIFILGVALLTVGGLIGSIPLIGTILLGLLFFLAIIVGLIIAFLTIGLVAGFPLMYPTIAAEGSDSFDAISRSISYVFSRPWRAGLYATIALVYGTITYLFVRLFALVALKATHLFVSWGVIGGGDSLHPAADKLDVMWNAPTYSNLFGPMNWAAMSGVTPLGAWLLNVWVFLVAAGVAAYLLSYAASSTSAIYFLLRRKVDATDLDDVYVEEAPEPMEDETAEAPAEEPEAEEQSDESEES